ncbi:MAG: FAD-dependent monooxygenase [Armatimonadota bacterium]|nr:MAG: FAD-dependent monooxygenase [Armatimonadota bacterium]
MPRQREVVIVGAGPAGIFAGLALSDVPGVRVRIVEKGPDIDARLANARAKKEARDPRWLLCGWGGAGSFSDGKLTLSPEVGGQLSSYLSSKQVGALLQEVDRMWLRFGAPQEVYGGDEDAMAELARRAARADLEFVGTRIRHMGTDRCPVVLREMRGALGENVEVHANEAVARIQVSKGAVTGVETAEGTRYRADYVIIAPGREGSQWFMEEGARLGLGRADNPVDVGVRVEVPAEVMAEVTETAYESKLIFYSQSFDDRVRTFCMCPYGEVVTEENEGVITVNGHSYAGERTANTNFALLVSTRFTEPFHDPIGYGRYLARLANLISDGVICQRLGDLRSGRRSTSERIARGLVRPTLASATPGDLSFALPYRYLSSILQALEALDQFAPGIGSRHTLLYGVEVKFYSARPHLTAKLETEVANLFAVGDGAGVTRGLVQASASGLLVGREVGRRIAAGEG